MKVTLRFIFILFIGFLASCATAPPLTDFEANYHMVNIDRDGNFVSVAKNKKTNFANNEKQYEIERRKVSKKEKEGQKDALHKEEKLDSLWGIMEGRILENASEHDGKKKLLLFVHGGLNQERDSFVRVQDQYARILETTDMYPVFIN